MVKNSEMRCPKCRVKLKQMKNIFTIMTMYGLRRAGDDDIVYRCPKCGIRFENWEKRVKV